HSICIKILPCASRGESYVKRHIGSDSHTKLVKSQSKQQTLSSIFAQPKSKMATAMANHNIPLTLFNHLRHLLPDIFPDSRIAKQYSSAATKMTCLINGTIAPRLRKNLVEVMKNSPYPLLIGGSNNTGLEKMNPLTVFDINTQRIENRLLDMCVTTGKDPATAAAIFNKIDQTLDTHSIPWANCVGFGVDNTSVNLRKRNYITTRVKGKNAACYFMGCPRHLVHNVACKSASSLTQLSGFDVEDLCVDLLYYFDPSTKRKSRLVEFSEFCDVKSRQVIKHVSARWPSLETAVQRNLRTYPALSYFLSNSESLPCFRRLKTQFADPLLEVYLLFYNAVLPTFTTQNRYLQREDPCIFAAYDQIQDFVKKINKKVLRTFVSIRVIREARYVENVQFEGEENQLEEEEPFTGLATKQRLQEAVQSVRQFCVIAIKESIAKLLLDENVFKALQFFPKRVKQTFTDVEFFVDAYSDLLLASPQDTEKLQEEFADYQLLEQTDVLESIWMDVIWGHLSSLKIAGGSLTFGRISKVAKTVLVLPHSNAEERVFSMVQKKKKK
uniref:HAT C-terminal dimerisation domain-containing protein n=1 Tax=Latimeria chalumnae TaxID=7897 RepID=H3B1S8_LATCH